MLSIIIPALNEAERIPYCLDKSINFLNKQNYDSEIIVVCDGCTDNTAEKAGSFKNKFNNLKIIEYFPNRGKGYAVKTGMLEAKGNLRMFMDADYAVPIETIETFINMTETGYDIVMGARDLKDTVIVKHQKYFRELAGKMFGRIQKFYLNIPYYDTQCGFKLFMGNSAEFLFPLIKYDCSYFDAEVIYIAHLAHMKIKEMPVIWKHDGVTRMPIGIVRTIELLKKLHNLKNIHKTTVPFSK